MSTEAKIWALTDADRLFGRSQSPEDRSSPLYWANRGREDAATGLGMSWSGSYRNRLCDEEIFTPLPEGTDRDLCGLAYVRAYSSYFSLSKPIMTIDEVMVEVQTMINEATKL